MIEHVAGKNFLNAVSSWKSSCYSRNQLILVVGNFLRSKMSYECKFFDCLLFRGIAGVIFQNQRESVLGSKWFWRSISATPCPLESLYLLRYMHHFGHGSNWGHESKKLHPYLAFRPTLMNALSVERPCASGHSGSFIRRAYARNRTNESIEMRMDEDVVRFNIGIQSIEGATSKKWEAAKNKSDMSRKAKLNELRFYRLKAKKKLNSPNPEVRIRYKLEKAKRKEAWLIEKLRKYELRKGAPETYDPEILSEEERFYLKRTGDKKKHYVPVGRRGVFGGVVLNMHLHWKTHETVKVICKPCKPGQVLQYAEELTRLSKGIVIDIQQNNTIIFYRGKNYVQPDVMSPTDTLSKVKALEKYRYEQSLEHTSEFIERLEKELAEYIVHRARYKKEEK